MLRSANRENGQHDQGGCSIPKIETTKGGVTLADGVAGIRYITGGIICWGGGKSEEE
jgi:hypothetical protein